MQRSTRPAKPFLLLLWCVTSSVGVQPFKSASRATLCISQCTNESRSMKITPTSQTKNGHIDIQYTFLMCPCLGERSGNYVYKILNNSFLFLCWFLVARRRRWLSVLDGFKHIRIVLRLVQTENVENFQNLILAFVALCFDIIDLYLPLSSYKHFGTLYWATSIVTACNRWWQDIFVSGEW